MKNSEVNLKERGYKMTTPRRMIYDYLRKEHNCVSAQTIHKHIKSIDLASVYRNLKIFEELKIVNVEIIDKEKLYCITSKPHHHIVCQACGYMEKVACDHYFDNFKNFADVSHRLTLVGLCNKCAKKK